MIRGIIDIGTNTCHLMIGEVVDGHLTRTILKKRFYTFLGESGLATIGGPSIERLWDALTHFEIEIERLACEKVCIIATEGLRTASNGVHIQEDITERFGWPIQIVSGDTEAGLILAGVQQGLSEDISEYLVMDIGGGSVEFILVQGAKVAFQKSYPIGIARLYKAFHDHDAPLGEAAVIAMNEHLESILVNLWQDEILLSGRAKLIGSAGTFEIFLSEAVMKDDHVVTQVISKNIFTEILQEVRHKSLEERKSLDGIPPERAHYIVVAFLLMRYVIDKMQVQEFIVSKYALKEGAIIDEHYF